MPPSFLSKSGRETHLLKYLPHYFMRFAQFYSIEIFFMDRLDTKGVCQK